MIYYLYESHLGDVYIEKRELPYEERHCDTCGDSDVLIGEFTNEKELRALLEREAFYPEVVECIVRNWKK